MLVKSVVIIKVQDSSPFDPLVPAPIALLDVGLIALGISTSGVNAAVCGTVVNATVKTTMFPILIALHPSHP